MGLNFTNITNKVWRATGTIAATYTAANIAIDVNLAQDEIWSEALKNNGWNVDDFNQTDYPIIYTNLVSGQRDYFFIKDEQGNYILNIYRVMIKDSNGVYHNIKPVDQQSSTDNLTMNDGVNTTGTPTMYDKTGHGIFLDLIPSYNSIKGLKIFIDREPTYFIGTDTTKVSGIDGLCHDFLYLKPSYEYCRDHALPQTEKLFRDLQVSMAKIKERYGVREKDRTNRLTPIAQNNK